jgi:UDP-glucose 4-epimerase
LTEKRHRGIFFLEVRSAGLNVRVPPCEFDRKRTFISREAYSVKVVAITGISGFIGRELLSQFDVDEEVEKIVGIDTVESRLVTKKLVFHKKHPKDSLQDIFQKERVQSCVHLPFTPLSEEEGGENGENRGSGIKNFLSAAEKGKVEVVTVLSSAMVYGAHADNPLLLYEGRPLRVNMDFSYGKQWLEIEVECARFVKRNPHVALQILRPCTILGRGTSDFIARYLQKSKIRLIKGYDPPAQFIHIDDLTMVIFNLMKLRKIGTFNVAADGSLKLSQIARFLHKPMGFMPESLLRFRKKIASRLRKAYFPEDDPALLSFLKYSWVVNNNKLKKELLYRFKYNSRDALVNYIHSLEHPDEYEERAVSTAAEPPAGPAE